MKKKKINDIQDLLKNPPELLTDREIDIIRRQIRYNSVLINHYIYAIDLLVNKERCPKDANTLAFLRKRLSVAMAESDTFRKVLWRHAQILEGRSFTDSSEEAATFLVQQITAKKRAIMAQLAMK